MSIHRRYSVEFAAEQDRITETAKKGGAHLRSAHAMEKRLRAKVALASVDAGIQLQHQWMRIEDIIAEIGETEDTQGIEATARLIGAGEKEREAAALEAKGGPRRLEKARQLREYARLDRWMVENERSCTGCNGPLLHKEWFEAHAGLCSNCERKQAEIAAYEAEVEGARPEVYTPSTRALHPRSWEAVRQTPVFAVAVDIARQERRSQIRLDQARATLTAIESECEDGYEAGDNYNAARSAYRNDNNVLWGAARMLAAMVDNDDELGALQVLRNELDRQDAGRPVSSSPQGPFHNALG